MLRGMSGVCHQLQLPHCFLLQVRIYAIRAIAELCKGTPTKVSQFAEILGQMLITGE
jgi:hypothetical protein